MIIAAAFAMAALRRDGESVVLRRSYLAGDTDTYTLRISPPGQATPLGNASQVTVHVNKNGLVAVVAEPSAYQATSQVLATWRPNDLGNVGKIQGAAQGFEFLPYAFTVNDSNLAPGEIEPMVIGSVSLISVKDSVAQLRVWMQVGPALWLRSFSDIEVATRRPNQIRGTIYGKGTRGLVPVRAFVLQRTRTGAIAPIPQESGG
jgi:hypothetical protein